MVSKNDFIPSNFVNVENLHTKSWPSLCSLQRFSNTKQERWSSLALNELKIFLRQKESKDSSNIWLVTVSAWVGSIAFGMNFLCGPITSGLCQRYGCRVVSAVGGLVAMLGLLLTSFTNSLYVIYLTYSVLWGFGSSLNYAPTMLVLGKLGN